MIGGIWVASASTSHALRVKDTTEAVQVIYHATENMFRNMPRPATPENITQPLVDAGVIAGHRVLNGRATHAWGGEIQVFLAATYSEIKLIGIPTSACLGLGMKLLDSVTQMVRAGYNAYLQVDGNDAWNALMLDVRCSATYVMPLGYNVTTPVTISVIWAHR